MHIFTYGSLMFPEVWQRVVRGQYASVPARLDGFRRSGILGVSYPGIVEAADASVEGVLYLDIDALDVAALDRFEGFEYERREVDVLAGNGRSMRAGTYVYLRPDKLSGLAWQLQGFDVARFLQQEA